MISPSLPPSFSQFYRKKGQVKCSPGHDQVKFTLCKVKLGHSWHWAGTTQSSALKLGDSRFAFRNFRSDLEPGVAESGTKLFQFCLDLYLYTVAIFKVKMFFVFLAELGNSSSLPAPTGRSQFFLFSHWLDSLAPTFSGSLQTYSAQGWERRGWAGVFCCLKTIKYSVQHK